MAGGRPRAFDVDEVLDRALEVFWRHGYEGAGISQLTSAMGINPPSLYNTFGNKQELFRQVLDRYADGPAGYMQKAFTEPTALQVVEALLHGGADATTRPDCPPGCLTLQGGLAAAPGSEQAVAELARRRAAGETALRARLERAQDEGEIPADASPADLARFFATVFQGLAVQAVGGASSEELHRVIDLAMKAWPTAD
ncbi:TetR/AcrR family transcriptional regulator [Streptacidiphilus sp. ASG 303]|uniref:TetR/AcrR family transcriptional regulator n=1 Tax=Streptacidiphilus sp. ASG 303 TaxID=2896847 RepID=UPI001E4B5F49|nr:TetR/AcrR family transcriptional regulator [Streptacidiphilus sp. ASG 303]MCD0486041.1 TetR/AcrR family transcriptional regulator [Streptacidiphilus sp. ASG 303]